MNRRYINGAVLNRANPFYELGLCVYLATSYAIDPVSRPWIVGCVPIWARWLQMLPGKYEVVS